LSEGATRPPADPAGSAAAAPAAVGGQLRAARIAAQLSVEDIARALKFSPRQIEALETDNYAALPGGAFVRGFVRNYARLLKLDSRALLRQVEAALPSAPVEVRPPENMGAAGSARGLDRFPPLLAAALIVLIAVLLLGLWHFFAPSAPTRTVVGQAAESVRQLPEPAAPAAQVIAPTPAPPGASVLPPPPASLPESSVPTLRFAFSGRSWVEVTDARRQLVHSGESPAGSQLALTGKPPFEIVIGNAAAVSLVYGDRLVDLAPHTRAEVARLRLE